MLDLDAPIVRMLHRGQHLAFPGDRMQDVFVIEAGWLARYIRLPSGGRQITSLYLPGEFCEPQWIIAPVSSEWIVALSDVAVSGIQLHQVIGGQATDPAASRRILADIPCLLARQSALVAAVGRKSGVERLCALLSHLCERSAGGAVSGWSGAIPLTQGDLADIVGLTPIHVNRVLKELRARGTIEVRRGALIVLDPEKLRAMADRAHFGSFRTGSSRQQGV